MADPRFRHLHAEAKALSNPDAFSTIATRMRSYAIYPPRMVAGQVCSVDGRVRRGVTIIQTARLGPLRIRSAVRVGDVREVQAPGRREFSFSYATLKGHPEEGVIRFCVKEEADASVTFTIDAWSRPGAWWSTLGRPIAAAWQRRANQKAVAHVTRPSD